ncbi:MAG: beta-propeller domain-containing protein, partial [Clostridia bacterium]|nr:beta-propeller domain-containing protein [Clostridia bacterium]
RTLEKVGGVDKFADGEEVKSVCFRDDTAYVCSAHGSFYLINSVSVLDLSDPNRVTVKDNGSIKGYSTSLVALPNGDFLGIGFDGGNRFLKVEVYRQTEDGVASVAVYQRPNISYVSNSRTFLIDRENGYFGIPIHDIGRHESAFVLLSYDGERLTEQLTVPYETGSSNCVRGLLIDGYFYLFTWNGAFSAIPFPTGEPS